MKEIRLEGANKGKERVERRREEVTRGNRKSRWKKRKVIYEKTTKFEENETKKKVQERVNTGREGHQQKSRVGWNLKKIKENETAERRWKCVRK